MANLKFFAISGTTAVTENMYVYEYDNQILIVDCGVGFPEEATFGIDLIIPDFSYVIKNKEKVKAIIISHGHEDHLGALPFLFDGLQAPIYATALVAGFIEDKFADYGKKEKVNIFNPEKDTLQIGHFIIDSFRVSLLSVTRSLAAVLFSAFFSCIFSTREEEVVSFCVVEVDCAKVRFGENKRIVKKENSNTFGKRTSTYSI